MNPQLFTQPLSDYNLDNLSQRDGLLRTMPALDLDLPDKFIIKTLHQNIEDSSDFYNDVNEYNLKNKRLKNEQMLQGRHLQEHKLYRHQTPYIDNELFVGVDAIVSYVTAQTPRAEVYPASDKEESIYLATNLEKYLHFHAEIFELPRKMEGAIYNMLGKYIGLLKLRWDPNYGEVGEIVPEVVDPNHVIIDRTAKLGENPRFICHVLRDTVEGLIDKFPDKEQDILRLFAIKRKGPLNMSAEVAYREVWFTYYDKKDKKFNEAVCWYVRDLVLDKKKDPNWLYEGEGKNFLTEHMKPFIPFNLTNDGSNWLDKTNAVEQAVAQQEILNKVGRQIIDNIATANGFKVIDAYAMTKDDAQNFTGDPNQMLIVKTKPNMRASDMVAQLPPQIVSKDAQAMQQDARSTVHNILGTPSQFRGDDEEQTKTATQAMMIKNQASGRQDKIVRSVDLAMDKYFKFLTQMMCVWYTEKHYATVNGGDGNFDFIEMHKDKIENGMTVRVQSGTTLPFDKARQEAVAQNAAELGLLSPYDYYKLMHMDNPQKLYDNMMKWKSDPTQLAMDIAQNQANGEALVDFTELMAGKKVEQRDDVTPEYIDQMRKQMITDEFLRAKASIRNNVIKFVNKAVDSLAIRTELDQMSAPPPPPKLPADVAQTMPTPPPAAPPMQPGAMPPGANPAQPFGPSPLEQSQGGTPVPTPASSPIQSIMQTPPQAGSQNLNPAQPQTNGMNIGQLPPV